MAAWLDNCDFNATSTGTVDFVLSTALAGRQTLALAGATNTKPYKYYARSADLSQWEIGEGAANTATSTIPRTTVLYNSSGTGTAAGQSGAGTKISFTTVPLVAIIGIKEDLISVEEANSFTATQKSQARTNIAADFETGTVMLFYQAAAPTGWTKVVTQNDKALRVVSGTGGVSGGTNAFSTVMAQTVVGNTTLSTTQMPSHAHGPSGGTSFWGRVVGGGGVVSPGGGAGDITTTDNQGGGGSHNHPITMAVQYIDLILASKN